MMPLASTLKLSFASTCPLSVSCTVKRSEQGAATQAILMSVYRTLKLRGHDPSKTIAEALRTFLQSGTLPTLPAEIVANG